MATYYVNATGGDDSRSAATAQNIATPWLTIQKALDTVPINGGDTIEVAAGTYTEGARLSLSRTFLATVTVRPASGATVVITENGTGTWTILINTNTANVTFDGTGGTLTIQDGGSATYGVGVANNATGVADVAFVSCTITCAKNSGYAVGCLNCEIDGLTFTGCTLTASGTTSSGIAFTGKATGFVTNVTLTNCTVSGTRYGVTLGNAGRVTNVTISGGTYSSTAGAGTGCAIGLINSTAAACANWSITGITVADGSGKGAGIELGGAAGSVFAGLTISNCTIDVRTAGGCAVTINAYVSTLVIDGGSYQGTYSAGGRGGIFVNGNIGGGRQVSPVTIQNVYARGDADTLSLDVEGCENVTIQDCRVVGAGRGITLADQVVNCVIQRCVVDTDDQAFRCGHDGTSVYTNDTITVQDCIFHSADLPAAILGTGISNVTFRRNMCTGGQEALRIRATASAVSITDNIFMDGAKAVSGYSPVATVVFSGTTGVTFQRNLVIGSSPIVFKGQTNTPGSNSALTITDNTVILLGSGTFWSFADTVFTGTDFTVDRNIYVNNGTSATPYGTVWATASVATIAAARTAWDAVKATNDEASSEGTTWATWTLPTVANVWYGSGVYGIGGSGLTPSKRASSITNCSAANVANAVTIDDVTGNGATTNAANAATLEAQKSALWTGTTVTFGASSVTGTKRASSITNCTAPNVRNGVVIDDVTGTAVSNNSTVWKIGA